MPRQERFTIITMVYLSLFTLGLIDNLRGALFPEILRFFHTSDSLGAWFYIIASLFSIIGGLLTQKFCERFSSYSVWRSGLTAMALGSFMIYLSSSFAILLFACALLGLGFGILAVTQNLLVAKVTSGATTKRALSGLHSMYGISSFLAPLCVTMSTLYNIPWQDLYLGAGLLALGLLAFSFNPRWALPRTNAIHQPSPRTHRQRTEPLSRARGAFFPFAFNLKLKKPTLSLPQSPALMIMMIASYVGLEMLICTRLTSFLTIDRHWPLHQASAYLTYFFLFLLAGRLLFSFYHPPISIKTTLQICLLGNVLFVFAGLNIHPFFLTLTGLAMAPFYPLSLALVAEMFAERVASVMSKIIVFQSLSVIIMNLIVGWISQNWSVSTALYLSFIFIALSWTGLLNLPSPLAETKTATEPLPLGTPEDEFPREWTLQSDELKRAEGHSSSPPHQ